jgi:Protein of unknown function (DUF2846)
MRRTTLYLLLFLVSLSSSWAQENAAASRDSAKATVYVYRYKQFVGAALSPSVYCDDVQLARMENGRYFTTTVEPGKHIFRSNDEQSGIALLAAPGQQYFVRVDIAAGFMKGHGRLQLMDNQQGRYELTSDKLKPLDAGKVVAKDKVSVEVAHPQLPTQAIHAAPAATPAAVPVANNPAPAATLQPTAAPAAQPTHQNVSVTTNAVSPSSMSSDPTSLGDAARLARQKKAQQK